MDEALIKRVLHMPRRSNLLLIMIMDRCTVTASNLLAVRTFTISLIVSCLILWLNI